MIIQFHNTKPSHFDCRDKFRKELYRKNKKEYLTESKKNGKKAIICKYCGKPILKDRRYKLRRGFVSRFHKECKKEHERKLNRIRVQRFKERSDLKERERNARLW